MLLSREYLQNSMNPKKPYITIVPQLLGSLRLNFTSLVNDDFGLSRTTNIYNNNIRFIYKCTEIK